MMSGLGATAAWPGVRPARLRAELDLVGLTPLMEVTTGSSEVAIGLIDGPVAASHPGLAAQAVPPLPIKDRHYMRCTGKRRGNVVHPKMECCQGFGKQARCKELN